jgi:hypothetical protein
MPASARVDHPRHGGDDDDWSGRGRNSSPREPPARSSRRAAPDTSPSSAGIDLWPIDVEGKREQERRSPDVYGVEFQRLVTAGRICDQPNDKPDQRHSSPPLADSRRSIAAAGTHRIGAASERDCGKPEMHEGQIHDAAAAAKSDDVE